MAQGLKQALYFGKVSLLTGPRSRAGQHYTLDKSLSRGKPYRHFLTTGARRFIKLRYYGCLLNTDFTTRVITITVDTLTQQ